MVEPVEMPAPPRRCAACGFENAPATQYCQDCGAKLAVAPPSYLQADAPAPVSPVKVTSLAGPVPPVRPPVSTHRPRILSARRERPALAAAGRALRLLVAAGLLALAALMLWPPGGLPPAATAIDAQTTGEIRAGLTDVAQRGREASAPWGRLNAYLAAVLAPAAASGSLASSFVRAAVQNRPGGFTLTIQKSIVGIPLYISVFYRPVSRNGRLTVEATGAAIGRLPLPASAAPFAERLGGDLTDALAFELQILRSARTVRLDPAGVHVDFRPIRP